MQKMRPKKKTKNTDKNKKLANVSRRLTDGRVRRIRDVYHASTDKEDRREALIRLAKQYEVSYSTVFQCATRSTYAEVV